MCGIAGYIGRKELGPERIEKTLLSMRERGPDHQASRKWRTRSGTEVVLMHSRLSIIDLDARSHQPFVVGDVTLVLNGEIYNYVELKAELEKRGHAFSTTSDTEVLARLYVEYGESGFSKCEGMWAAAVWDANREKMILSRDRFGEKPLYYSIREGGFYFASETRILKELMGWSPSVNRTQVSRYLGQGYRSLFKQGETFFEGVKEWPAAETGSIGDLLEMTRSRYWNPQFDSHEEMSLEEAVLGSRECLLESLRIRLRADVPLAFCLSGGVDSTTLLSFAVKQLGCQAKAFSIIDSDERYNEEANIRETLSDLGCEYQMIPVDRSKSLEKLSRLIAYHDAPVATITYYVHSLLTEAISREGYRVAFSGIGADEIFSGYYDHHLMYLAHLGKGALYDEASANWSKHVFPLIRNETLRQPRLFVEASDYREHLYDSSECFRSCLPGGLESFTEKDYGLPLLRNRMLNEMFVETVPVVLREEDLNSMRYSIENRSPYLDSRLFEFVSTVPTRHLMRHGYAKWLLRALGEGVVNERVRLERQKKGFNASIHSMLDLGDPGVKDFLFDPGATIFEVVQREALLKITDSESTIPAGAFNKFMFAFVNARIFLEQQG